MRPHPTPLPPGLGRKKLFITQSPSLLPYFIANSAADARPTPFLLPVSTTPPHQGRALGGGTLPY